ncbi:TPA: hypothetical protein N0F65_003534 [Lagenidium giganteum]|uniref:Palmitoyltransferase n=1 Tax=Lagenidium giganteum TaxID=4803 RepID=A0AAV2Z308_9STRA|nr:TPA: hypothetical protein N0F65_003534 [Lagenidium giganteum]
MPFTAAAASGTQRSLSSSRLHLRDSVVTLPTSSTSSTTTTAAPSIASRSLSASPPDSPLSGGAPEVIGDKLLGHVRTNGFERPFGRDQVISWLGHGISAVCFYVAAIWLMVLDDTPRTHSIRSLTSVALFIHIPALVLLLMAWISCERIDPEESLPNGWFGIKLGGKRWMKARYCAVCRKTVPGLDHHCTWLQTCIGVSNYAQFFTIACAGTVQFICQALYASFSLLWLHIPVDAAGQQLTEVKILLLVCLFISVPCTITYFVLLGFHTLLFFLGYGTYDWMLRRRKRQRELAKAKSNAAKSNGAETTPGDGAASMPSPQSHSSSFGSPSDFTGADPSIAIGQMTSL